MFEPGEHVGAMHCHTLSSIPLGSIRENTYQTKSIFPLDAEMAIAIANNIPGLGFSTVNRNNKQAYVVSTSASGEVLVIYSYDHGYYLTTLANAPTPYAVFPENVKA